METKKVTRKKTVKPRVSPKAKASKVIIEETNWEDKAATIGDLIDIDDELDMIVNNVSMLKGRVSKLEICQMADSLPDEPKEKKKNKEVEFPLMPILCLCYCFLTIGFLVGKMIYHQDSYNRYYEW